MKFTFKKDERLCSKKIMQQLFAKGRSFSENPIRVVYLPVALTGNYPVQIMISVPKKKFKSAVTRNRIKRQMREAYRLNKNVIYQHLKNKNQQLAVTLIFTGKEMVDYAQIEHKIILSLQRLVRNYGEATELGNGTDN